jgi:hypothetical protein
MDRTCNDRYILLDKTPVPEPSLSRWGMWMEIADRRVALSKFGDVEVSTVFLGIDHNFWDVGPPLLFETMIFGGPLDQEQWRYSTWEEAEAGHQAACALIEIGPAIVLQKARRFLIQEAESDKN